MVEDDAGKALTLKFTHPGDLQGAGVFAGGFDFDKHAFAAQHADAVWDARQARECEFPADAADAANSPT
ncbi:hypothetical protein KJY77_00295 [Canibacter sp. lx-72]|uniref:hypothetical protein n=1 Tax=Canibacter zhuwentaonis TaxID=2837491 RepID=UPI001BDC8CE5|nr:hypothetical protein [Canibacter zhuwentaonis]MBT1017586.1 hypothetical protein [Canibacter zhuwentaonis]